jgi:hypothetical protein
MRNGNISVVLSVRMEQLFFLLMDFREISCFVIFTKIFREKWSLFNIRQKITGILYEDLRTFMTELITSVTMLVNKANLVHNFFLVYLFLVYLSIST